MISSQFTRMASVLLVSASLSAQAQHAVAPSVPLPKTGSSIKTLSAQDVINYTNGRGMGLAKAAELNGYPGPMHALQLDKELKLTTDQKAAMELVFDAMHVRAVELGKQIVQHEAALNQLFASEKVTPASLQAKLDTLAQLQGQLRLTHLDAHLKTKRILLVEQINQYNQLQGYK